MNSEGWKVNEKDLKRSIKEKKWQHFIQKK